MSENTLHPVDAELYSIEAEGGTPVERGAIDDRYKWNLSTIFTGWEAWEAAFEAVEAQLPEVVEHRGTLARSAADLLKGLEAVLGLRRALEIVIVYASLRSDEDTRCGSNLARKGRANTLGVDYAEQLAWFRPELIDIDEKILQTYLEEEPRLELYRQYLDKSRRMKEFTLAPEQESILAAAINITRGAGSVFSALNNADLKFPDIEDEDGRQVEMTKGNYIKFLMSADRRVRQDAFSAHLDTYNSVINTMAANLDANVKNHVFFTRARGYDSTLDAALFPNAIPTDVYHELVAATRGHLDVVHRYVALKKRMLNVPDIREYDLYTPLFPKAEFHFSYEEACDLLLEALAPLGSDYLDILREGFGSGWIDVHENRGKRSGAYSSGVYDTSPYILLNWSGQLQDTFTLAHELGHSVHSWLAGRNQEYVYGDFPIFIAEVASTCNELLLMHYLLDQTTDRTRRLFLLDRHLSQVNNTVVRQVMFAEFEYAVHRLGEDNETLTADNVGDIYAGLLADYWGPEVELDPARSRLTWARVPHFYYNYYVYQYATAYSAAAAFQAEILAGDEVARERYLDVLRSGGSRYPVDTLQAAGVDMTKPDPVEKVYSLFAKLLDDIEGMLDEEE